MLAFARQQLNKGVSASRSYGPNGGVVGCSPWSHYITKHRRQLHANQLSRRHNKRCIYATNSCLTSESNINLFIVYIKGEPRNVLEMADAIRATLRSMGNGEISVSPYDTAWVALVKKVDNGGEGPQFPSCIDWIAQNQLPDGSWSDDAFFLVQDRIINTLACTIALKSWNVHHDKCNKGLSLIHENMSRLPEDDEDWMLAGFETIFPTLLEMAKI